MSSSVRHKVCCSQCGKYVYDIPDDTGALTMVCRFCHGPIRLDRVYDTLYGKAPAEGAERSDILSSAPSAWLAPHRPPVGGTPMPPELQIRLRSSIAA